MSLIASALAASAVLAAGAAASQLRSTKNLKVKHEAAVFSWLPKRLDGLKILHVSDLHGNSGEKMNLDIWPQVESQSFDMAAITGDVIISRPSELNPHLPSIAKLASRCPTLYVQGNHEGRFFMEMRRMLGNAGVTVLGTERISVRIAPFGPVSVIGLRDLDTFKETGFGSADRLLKANDGKFSVVLCHQPQILDRMSSLSLGLILSGHTHGGQIRLPGLPTLYAPNQGFFPKLGAGWVERGKNKLYISCGIGTTHFPIRIFNMAEVAVIELKHG
jgi:predicted MPP superfamily phosphohydrolase